MVLTRLEIYDRALFSLLIQQGSDRWSRPILAFIYLVFFPPLSAVVEYEELVERVRMADSFIIDRAVSTVR